MLMSQQQLPFESPAAAKFGALSELPPADFLTGMELVSSKCSPMSAQDWTRCLIILPASSPPSVVCCAFLGQGASALSMHHNLTQQQHADKSSAMCSGKGVSEVIVCIITVRRILQQPLRWVLQRRRRWPQAVHAGARRGLDAMRILVSRGVHHFYCKHKAGVMQ